MNVYPDIALEWNYEKNIGINPSDLHCGSGKKVWWRCPNGHEYEATVHNRTRNGSDCPYCSGRKALTGVNDLQTLMPELAQEWNYKKNPPDITPSNTTCGTSKKVWWLGHCGHEWQANVYHRVQGRGCPYCSGVAVLEGFNDLASVNPIAAKDWHPTKNGTLLPNMVSKGSKKMVWWLGACGHEWQAQVNSHNRGHGCPFCAGKAILPGFNDLLTTNPFLASEWHPTRNGQKTAEHISGGTEEKIWWLGRCGHEWKASPKSRNNGTGCPICSKRKQSSFPEQVIYFYLKQIFQDAINGYTEVFTNKMELDIYIPSLNSAVEYDGKAFHSSNEAKNNEKVKYEICRKHDIRLIRVREFEADSPSNICDDQIVLPHRYSFSDLDRVVEQIIQLLTTSENISVSTERDKELIKSQYYFALTNDSIASVRPDLAAEWHPVKNGILTPDMFSKGSGEKVWWQCSHGHEWEAVVNSRYKGNNCPYCSGKKRLRGFNDLLTVRPDLAAEWHPTKNGELMPSMVQCKSKQKVWWKCRQGHEWEASISHRSSGSGCPYCWGRFVIKGQNDFETVYPELSKLWHPTKNENLRPSMVTKGSEKIVWWQGQCGHEWKRAVKVMSKSKECPYCTNREVLSGYNDLESTMPDVAKEWHPIKNGEMKPSMFLVKSGKKVWWFCNQGHEWEARICDRSNGSGCPECRRKKEL